MMEVNRRGLFAVFAGAAASGKSIAATAKETMMSSRIQDVFSAAANGVESLSTKCSPVADSSRNNVGYWKKRLKNLSKNNVNEYSNLSRNTNRKKIEIECLRSVSFSHKIKMQSDVDDKRSIEYEKIDILKSLKNVISGRSHWDNGED